MNEEGDVNMEQEKQSGEGNATIRMGNNVYKKNGRGCEKLKTNVVKNKRRIKRGPTKKEWILKKKETRILRGAKTAGNSKFTGRKRKPKF